MSKRDDYLQQISKRGDVYGGNGGLLDLLIWCDKVKLPDVTEDEARAFLENAGAPCSCLSGKEIDNLEKS